MFAVYSCTSVSVSLHHWDDESETSSGRRTADLDGKYVPSVQSVGSKTHSVSTPHRLVFVSVSSLALYGTVKVNNIKQIYMYMRASTVSFMHPNKL